MTTLEEIRQKKLAEMQAQQQNPMNEEMQFAQQIQQLENMVKQKFTKDALERYGNLKAAHPEKAVQLLAVIGQYMNQVELIDDEKLKEILLKLAPPKKEFKIKRV